MTPRQMNPFQNLVRTMTRPLPIMSLGLLFVCAQPARAATFINQVLSDSPRGFWVLDDAPGLPATATDSSPNAFNGTYGLGISRQGIAGPIGVAGSVAKFEGGNISFPSPLDLGANGYSIEAWINPTVSSLTQTTRIVASGDGNNGYGFGTAAGAELVFTTFTRRDYFTTTLTLQPNQWQYVGVVLDASNAANFYLNGVLVETVAGGVLQTAAPSTNFTIGNQSPGGGHTDEIYTGGLAGVSVYNTALTTPQILAQYNAAIPEPSSLVLMGLGAGCAVLRRRRTASSSAPRQ
jgi:hypothetical protein